MRRTLALVLVLALPAVCASGYLVGGVAAVPAVDGSGEAPTANETWERTYDHGDGNEVLFDAVPAGDGYLLVGAAELGSHGSERWDGWLVKVNAIGSVQWERTVGGAGADVFTEVAAVEDGYVVGGRANGSSRYGGGSARWLVGVDAAGEVQWSNTYEPDSGYASVEGLTATPDGHVIAVGDSAALRVRGGNGSTVWAQSYRSPAVVTGIERAAGGYALAGTGTARSDVLDGWLGVIDGSGTLQWERHYVRDGFNRPEALAVTDGGDFVLGGRSDADGTSEVPAWVIGADAEGDPNWERYLREPTDDGWVFDATAGANGSVVLAGKSIPGSGWVRELDAAGSTTASHRLGNTAKGVIAIGDGRYLAVGGSRRPLAAVAHVVSFVPPAAGLRVDPATTTVGEPVTLDASDSRGASEYRWDLDGDNTVDRRTDSARIQHAFDRVGANRVTVTVGGGEGTTATANATVRITDETPPVADLDASPATAIVGSTVRLDASESSDEGRIVAYRWDLDGDDEYERSTRDPVVEYTVDSAANVRVRVQVVDAGKHTDTATAVVAGRENRPPTLDVTVDDDLRAGVVAFFEANVTDDTGDVTVTWEFPDGERTGEDVVARLDAGQATIRVVARDEFGATTVRNVTVTVPADREARRTATSTATGAGFGSVLAVLAVLLWAVGSARRE